MTEFDDIVALATAICGTPIAVVTLGALLVAPCITAVHLDLDG